jgi:hypothetical protein
MRLLIAGYALQIKQTVSRVKNCPLSALRERGSELTGEKILSQGSSSVTESRSASGSQIDSLIPKTISSILICLAKISSSPKLKVLAELRMRF